MNSWRVLFLTVGLLVGFGVIITRLFDLHIAQFSYFQSMASSNTSFTQALPAERGVFTDRYGGALVQNSVWYSKAQDALQLYADEVVVPEDAVALNMATSSAQMKPQYQRLYPFGRATAHVLGYVGPVTKADLEERSTLSMTDRVGKVGLEKVYDAQLQGIKGSVEYAVDALGTKLHEVQRVPSQPGQVIQTTLDPYLSQVALQALGDNTGAVLVVDSETGALLTMVSSPSFDPNLFSQLPSDDPAEGERQRALQQELQDPNKRFFNRALAAEYPPGSVFKLVTALAALEEEKIDASTTVLDEGELKVGDYSYANWFYTQYGGTDGEITLQRALARSNDIFFYKTAEYVGAYRLAEWARTLGFGRPVLSELGSSATGLVPDPTWKEQNRGEQWFLGNTYHFGIGQGDLLVTPLQIAQLVQTIAHRGAMCPVHELSSSPAQCSSLGLNDQHVALVLAGMHDACSPGGTGFMFFDHNQEWVDESDPYQRLADGSVACKTGTAEFGGLDERGFRRTHGWFAMTMAVPPSVFQAEQRDEPETSVSETISQNALRQQWLQVANEQTFPRNLSIVVVVESDETRPYREGSRDAGPIAKNVFDFIYGSVTE